MKPPFAYYGGKAGMARRIVGLLPPHRVYLEPFLGSGAVLFAKAPAAHEIVNDLDGNVVAFFRMLRDRPDDLEHACRLSPYARDEYLSATLEGDLDDLERARRFWVRVNQSFNKTAGRQRGWSISTANTQPVARRARARVDRLLAVAARLADVAIEHCDAADLISRLSTADSCVYADPPYLAETRSARAGRVTDDYGCDMGSEEEHERLAVALHETPAAVILSGYHSPLYDRLYGDWPRLEIPVLAHSSNAATAARGERLEVLWSNRPINEGRLDLGLA